MGTSQKVNNRKKAPNAFIHLFRGSGILGWLIRKQTRKEFAHAEIEIDGILYAADAGKGVTQTFATGEEDSVRIPVYLPRPRKARLFVRKQLDKKYDYSSVLRFVSRRQATRKSSGKWFCSELVFAVCMVGGLRLFNNCEPWEVSPGIIPWSTAIDADLEGDSEL